MDERPLPKFAIVLNPQAYSGMMPSFYDQVAFDNIAPYRGRVGKVLGEYEAKNVYDNYPPHMVVLEFDDGKQFAFYRSAVTFLEKL